MYEGLERQEAPSGEAQGVVSETESSVGTSSPVGGVIPDVSSPPEDGGDGGADASGGRRSPSEQAYGDLGAERIGQQADEGDDQPMSALPSSEAGKGDIAAQAGGLPPQGGAEELAGGVKLDGVAPGGGGDAAAVSPEIAASIGAAQNETREAVAQAEGESAAFNAEMAARRDRFDGEQHAMMLDQLKTMSPADKRSTLKDMGYDEKAVKKMKDAELDRIISGKIETEQRQTRIMGMTPDELAKLTPDRKIQHLVDLGIDKEDLDKVGPEKACKLFDDVMAVAHVPGQHKVKIKIKGGLLGKSWVVDVKCDAEGNTDIQAKKEGGFLSKLWGWVKLALPIILMVLAPLTAGASLIALAIYQAATAIASGDWLGAIIAGAGALVGVGAFMAAKGALGAASTFAKVAQVAGKVKSVAQAAQGAMLAAKAKNAGSLMGALASGAAAFAQFSANSADKLAQTMTRWSERLKKWGAVISGGETVIAGIKSGDPIAAVGGAFDTVGSYVDPKGKTGKSLERASMLTTYANAGKQALANKPPNYAFVAEAALGIAGTLTNDRRLEDGTRIFSAANRLKAAWDNREANPGGLAEAAFGVAQAIQIANYDAHNEEKKDADGKPIADDDRTAYIGKYEQAGRIVRAAGAAVTAARTKPPNYTAALNAGTQLIAEFTENKRLDEAAVLTGALDAWTAAVNRGDRIGIEAAGIAFGEAINGMRESILSDRAAARAAAAAKLPAGETLPDDHDTVPHYETDETIVGGDGEQTASEQAYDDPQGPQAKSKTAVPQTWSSEPMGKPLATLTMRGPVERKSFGFQGSVVDAEEYCVTYSDGVEMRIFAPKAPTPGYHNHTVNEIANAAAFMPKSARAQITYVQLNPITNPKDPYWAVEYKAPNFHSYMTAGAAGIVTVYPDKVTTPLGGVEGQRNALVHETGHTWSYRTWGPDRTKGKWLEWKKAMDLDSGTASGYATSSIAEDVAETIRVYVATKGTPRYAVYEKYVPNRFAMLKREYDK